MNARVPVLLLAHLTLSTTALFAQAPSLPNWVAQDSRMTWRPTMHPKATAVVNGTVVTDWRSGTAVNVPVPTNRSPLGVALDLCTNNAGDWIGFTGTFAYEFGLGDKNDPRSAARTQGYQGVSLVGLDQNPASPMRSTLWGLHLAQKTGVQSDIALIGCIVDSHSIMPIQTMDLANPPFGNIYLEAIKFLTISNDQAHANPSGKTATTRVIRGHGAARWHVLNCEMLDGYVLGDGQSGASEHFMYYDGQRGDSEVVGCKVRGPQWSGIQAVGRYTDRIKAGTTWFDRYPFGKLLVEDCWFENVGSAGTACVNIAGGGMLDVTVKNCEYSAGFITTGSSGQVGVNGWLGMAIQTYTDHKAWELDDVNYLPGQGPSIARGYSQEPNNLPISQGLTGMLPDDGFGACRSITVIGGKWRRNGGGSPLFSFRDCKNVSLVYQGVQPNGQPTLPMTLAGGPIMFCPNGTQEQCGKAGTGLVPVACGPGYWQQARFIARKAPSTWINVPVKMGANRRTLSPMELDSWEGVTP